MPTIPKFRTEGRIDDRASQGSINREGASSVSEAISNLGGIGANIATHYLQKEKDAQTTAYTNSAIRTKSIDSERKWTELSNTMDPSTGLMPDKRSLYDHWKEWEDSETERYSEDAPTDDARQYFLSKDRPLTNERLLNADKYQYDARKKYRVKLRNKRYLIEDPKRITSHDPNNNISHFDYGNELLRAMQISLKDDVGTIENYNKNLEYEKAFGRAMANSSMAAMSADANIAEMGKTLKVGRLLKDPKLVKMLTGDLVEKGVLEEGDTLHGWLDDMTLVAKTSKGEVVSVLTGKPIDTKLVRGAEFKENIDVEGEGPEEENLIHYFLEPKDKIKHIMDMQRLIAQKLREDKNKHNLKINGMISKLRSSDRGVGLEIADGSAEEVEFESVLNVADEGQKYALLAAKVEGEFNRGNDLMPRDKALSRLQNIPGAIYKEADKRGVEYDKTSMGTSIQRSLNAAKLNLDTETQAVIKDSVSYLANKSPSFNKANSAKWNSPAEWTASRIKHDGLVKTMNLPEYITSQILSKGEATNRAHILSAELEEGPKDNYGKFVADLANTKKVTGDDYEKVLADMVSTKKIPKWVEHLGMFEHDAAGLAEMRDAAKSMHKLPEIEKNMSPKARGMLRDAVRAQTSVAMLGIRNKGLGGVEGDEAVASLNQLIYAKAAGLFSVHAASNDPDAWFSSDMETAAVESAKNADLLIRDHLEVTHSGNGVSTYSKKLGKIPGSGGIEGINTSLDTVARKNYVLKYGDPIVPKKVEIEVNKLKSKGKQKDKDTYRTLKNMGFTENKAYVDEKSKSVIPYKYNPERDKRIFYRPKGKKDGILRIPLRDIETNYSVQNYKQLEWIIGKDLLELGE